MGTARRYLNEHLDSGMCTMTRCRTHAEGKLDSLGYQQLVQFWLLFPDQVTDKREPTNVGFVTTSKTVFCCVTVLGIFG